MFARFRSLSNKVNANFERDGDYAEMVDLCLMHKDSLQLALDFGMTAMGGLKRSRKKGSK